MIDTVVDGVIIIDERGVIETVNPACVEMFGYATELRSLTQGRGAFTMEFHHYAEVAENVSDRILVGAR